MEKTINIESKEDILKLLNIALEHEWAVSFEYVIHAYSMPKGVYFYYDPIMQTERDARAQTIQIGIDEMYHALQLGIIITQMGGRPSFQTDKVIRYPRIIDNLTRDKMTEDMVTSLYQQAKFKEGSFPEIKNMVWNISYDEVRHSRQFAAMIDQIKKDGRQEDLCLAALPDDQVDEKVKNLRQITKLENALMHHYLKHVILFSSHQDLSQRLFKNSIDHMRHWDKNSGILVKLNDVIPLEKATKDDQGREITRQPMPSSYPGENRRTALESLLEKEKEVVAAYEKIIPLFPTGEIKSQLESQLALDREHLFTLEALLQNLNRIKGIY
ncbi:MAG TPA: ferritin-like domain-containing protein [Candidatus Aminicenantes bacterium]|nr:ferritin-like domain-containing protein [Candidatus Aminicenantes bacterium]